jgi:hypothetical protein
MRKLSFISSGALAALALTFATPAFAGDEERARAAIAEAQGKIDAAQRLNADTQVPGEFARAQASLRLAQEEIKSGHEQKAIQAAVEAQGLADSAIGRVQQRQQTAVEMQGAAAASAQADAAEAQARAEAAERAAATAQADAAAARAAPPVVVAQAPTTTTVTTETTKAAAAPVRTARAAPRKTVKRVTVSRPLPRPVETTKTTVTTTSN